MKKKIVTLCLAAALAVTTIVGTLAYFTDTDTETNVFTVGDIKIDLHEATKDGKNVDDAYQTWLDKQKLVPTTEAKVENTIDKVVTVENKGTNDAYLWAEIWVPSALDDGDDNSPAAPGLKNSLHFNYASNVVETKATYLGSKTIGEVSYNGYVHYVISDTAKKSTEVTSALLDHVYMDANVKQCTDETCTVNNCLVLADGTTHYDSANTWNMVVYGIGIQADEFATIEEAITAYYNKDITEHIWK